MSLAMKPTCKACDATLAPDGPAFICSYECTYCPRCAATGVCPTCHGEITPRPRRRAAAVSPLPLAGEVDGRLRPAGEGASP